MSQGGYAQLLKNKQPKERDYKDAKDRAKKRIFEKLGEELAESLSEEFLQSSPGEQDGMIKTLLQEGKSHIEIKTLFGVGGHRVSRLSDEMKENPEEREARQNITHTPKHALSETDTQRIKDHIDSYDLEPGYPCAHREPLLHFHDPQYEWKNIYSNYVGSLSAGDRVISSTRFREYVKKFYPRYA